MKKKWNDKQDAYTEDDICWTCSRLKAEVGDNCTGVFVCTKENVLLNPGDYAPSCTKCLHDRPCLRGMSVDLWRFLVAISKPIAVHSLPKNYIGAIGNLNKYSLVNIFTDTTKAQSGPLSFSTVKDRYIEAI